MSTAIVSTTDAKRELEAVIAQLVTGNRDPHLMQRSCERMDQMREELRQRIGTVEVAVELIRDARNQ